jgi:hypothetical protein
MKTNTTHADQLSEIDAQIVSLLNSLETASTVQIIDGLNGIREELIRTEMMIRRDADQKAITEDLTKATQWLITGSTPTQPTSPEWAARLETIIEEPEPAPLIADPKPCPDVVAVASNEGEPEEIAPEPKRSPARLALYDWEVITDDPEADPALPTPDDGLYPCDICRAGDHTGEECMLTHND